jgi:DNA-binding GntR family transcriptional regulator
LPYLREARNLRERIAGGEWLPGEALPPLRQLAEHYSVSHTTVRRAVRLADEAPRLLVITARWGVFRA